MRTFPKENENAGTGTGKNIMLYLGKLQGEEVPVNCIILKYSVLDRIYYATSNLPFPFTTNRS